MRSAVSTIEFLIGCGAVLAGSTAMIALGIVRMLLIVPIVIGILCGLFNGVGWLIVYWVKDESIPQAIHWCLGSFAVAFTAIVVQAMTHIASAWIGERVGRI
jgi:ribosomal protein S19